MRIVVSLLLTSAIVLSSCSPTTSGMWDKSLNTSEPYVFFHIGEQTEAAVDLKRILVPMGFMIGDYDSNAGLLTTNYKSLTDDERLNASAMAVAFYSVNSVNQAGRAVFMFTKSTPCRVEMRCYISANVEYRQNVFKNSTVGQGDMQIAQGHPLSIKIREAILANAKFSLDPKQEESRRTFLRSQLKGTSNAARTGVTQIPTAQPLPKPGPIEPVNRGPDSVAAVAAPPAKGFIGISLDKQCVTNVWAGGPAAKGGLKIGDIVIAANGQKLTGDNENDLKLIRGEPKTPLTLSIKRDGIDMTINTVREEDR